MKIKNEKKMILKTSDVKYKNLNVVDMTPNTLNCLREGEKPTHLPFAFLNYKVQYA